MKSKLLIFVSILLGILMILSGMSMVSAGFSLRGQFELFGVIWALVGIFPLLFVFRQISFRKKVSKTMEALEKHQNVEPVKISVFAEELGLDEKKTIALISDLIYFGYVDRVTIDHVHKTVIFLDTASVDGNNSTNFLHIKCSTCGGTNKVVKGKAYICSYCGTSYEAVGMTEKILKVSEKAYSDAEYKILKENLKIAYVTPLYYIPMSMLVISLFSVIGGLFSGNVVGGFVILAINAVFIGALTVEKVRFALLKIVLKLRENGKSFESPEEFWDSLNVFAKTALAWCTLSMPWTGVNAFIGSKIPDSSAGGAMGLFYLVTFPLGVLAMQGLYSGYGIFMAKYLRPLKAKYLALVIHMRNHEGTPLRSLANILDENEKTVKTKLKLLIKTKHLQGVYIKNGRVFYMDDDKKFDRYVPVQCRVCGGESVATYGKSNSCTYCGNPLNVPAKKQPLTKKYKT